MWEALGSSPNTGVEAGEEEGGRERRREVKITVNKTLVSC